MHLIKRINTFVQQKMESAIPLSINLSGVLLLLSLGLRHGLDPDHIAIIDGMTLRYNHLKSPFAKWIGTLFAIGHGFIVTLIAILFSLFTFSFIVPHWLKFIVEWIPIALLLFIGVLNLLNLLHQKTNTLIGWRTKLIPKKLKNSTNPLSIVLIGILFGLVFDTATQAAAWGFIAAEHGGVLTALLMGLIFSLGMIVTDTIDSRILHFMISKTDNQSLITHYRKTIGWAIVLLSFLMAIYKTILILVPGFTLNDNMNLYVGLSLVLLLCLLYLFLIFKKSKYPAIHVK